MEGDRLVGGEVLAVVLWAFVGLLVGGVLSALAGMLEAAPGAAVAFAIVAALVGWTAPLRGKIGIPIAALGGAVAGWLLGYVVQIWQVSALGVVLGSVGGAVTGTRFQARFTRNTRRGPGGRFYV